MRAARTEIRSLTGLRGIAALLIAIYHFGAARIPSPAFPRFDLTGAYLAVDAFFMLSGFVLAYNYNGKFAARFSTYSYFDFLIRRVARIYPAYLAFLLLYLLKMVVNISGDNPFRLYEPWDFIGNILMINGWGISMRPIIGPSWSVSAEMACYFIFPFMLYLMSSPRWRIIFTVPIIVAALLALHHANIGVTGTLDIIDGSTLWPLLRAFCGFLTGIMLFQIDARYHARLSPYMDIITMSALFAGALLWAFGGSDLLKFMVIALLVLGLTQDSPLGNRLFGNPPVHYLGEISYSLYLCHSLCIPIALKIGVATMPFVGDLATYTLCLTAYLVMILALAAMAYPILEIGGKKAAMGLYVALQRIGRRRELKA